MPCFPLFRSQFFRQWGSRQHRASRSGGLEGGEGGRSGTRQKIVTQPCEEVCDLGGAGSGARETPREPRGGGGGLGGGVAVQWRCHLPDRDVTQVAGHREPAIELLDLCWICSSSTHHDSDTLEALSCLMLFNVKFCTIEASYGRLELIAETRQKLNDAFSKSW